MLDPILNAFANLFVQIVFTAGIVGLCGMIISFCNKCFYDCLGDTAFFIIKASGIIGTPIHELSHALMCLIFGHRITKIQIYNFKKRSRILGFVEHVYNKRNLYNLMGNFFIGIAPIAVGGLVVTLLVALLTPQMYNVIMAEFSQVISAEPAKLPTELVSGMGSILTAFLSKGNLTSWRWWICVVLSFAVSIHMEISRSDIKGGLRGLAVISLPVLAVDLVLAFLFPSALTAVTTGFMTVGIYLSMFLTIPALFSVLVLLISGIISLTRALSKSIANDRK